MTSVRRSASQNADLPSPPSPSASSRSANKPQSAPPPPPTTAQQYQLEGEAEELLHTLDAILGTSSKAAKAAPASATPSTAEPLLLAVEKLLALFDRFTSISDASLLRSAVAQRHTLSHHAALVAAGVEAHRRVVNRSSELLSVADDLAQAGADVRASSLHLAALLAHCDSLYKAAGAAASLSGDDELRLNATHAEAARHWRSVVAAARSVRSNAERLRPLLAAPSAAADKTAPAAPTQSELDARRDLRAAEERLKDLAQQAAADKSLASAAAKREATLADEAKRSAAQLASLTGERDAALAKVKLLEQQLASANQSAAAATAAAAAAASAAIDSLEPRGASGSGGGGVATLQSATDEQLQALAQDATLKAKNDVLKEALRSASRAADELVTATLDQSSDLTAFVGAAKASAAALTRPLQLALQILSAARHVPVYTYENGTEDAEILARYKRAIFDLISDAKRIRTAADEAGGASSGSSERDELLLETRRSTLKTQLFYFGKCIESAIYGGMWL
jgi:hypothetical protein